VVVVLALVVEEGLALVVEEGLTLVEWGCR
jgi:hypothetical protein